MSKNASILYLCLAPGLFALSWYISHKIYERFLLNGSGQAHYEERSLVYASFLTAFYIVAFFVIRDLYKPERKS